MAEVERISGFGRESTTRSRTVVSTILFAMVVAIGALYPFLPRARALTETGFSAARALGDLAEFAVAPRPSGSAANDRARVFLVGRLRALGFEVEVHRTSDEWNNLIATRSGGHDSTGTLLLASHYDTVPSSPGAADDGMGVVTLLEVGRLLMEDSSPRNDLILLFTDGEERGMRGARAFVREHRLASAVSAVINLEAAGGEGSAVLFDSGPDSGHIIRAFSDMPPFADSFSEWIFAALPNNTDYAAFREQGIPGVNLATVAGSQVYHAAFDRVDRVDAGSLQHLGDVTLAASRRLLGEDLRRRETGSAYRDVFGSALLVWPARWSRLAGALFLVVAILRFRSRPGLRAIGRSTWRAMGDLFVSSSVLWVAPAVLLLVVGLVYGDDITFMSPHGGTSAAAVCLLGQTLLASAMTRCSVERAEGWIGVGWVVLLATVIGFPQAVHFALIPVAALFAAHGMNRSAYGSLEWLRMFLSGLAVLAIVPLVYRVGLLAHVRAPLGLLVGAVAAAFTCGVGAQMIIGWGRTARVTAGLAGLVTLAGWALVF